MIIAGHSDRAGEGMQPQLEVGENCVKDTKEEEAPDGALNALMITGWHFSKITCMFSAVMITIWHYCISVELVTRWVHWIVTK